MASTLPLADDLIQRTDPAWPTLWPLLLQIVQRRRSGERPGSALQWAVPDAPDGTSLRWAAGSGWFLAGDWPHDTLTLFNLYKPLLDVAAGGAPWVIGQLGQSLDGCVATHDGDSRFVTGTDNLFHLHRLRALCDAVIVGAGTVAADNPQLTTRRVPGGHPVRVVLDPGLRVSRDARVFHDGQAPTLWLCDARCSPRAESFIGADSVLGVPGLIDADGRLSARAAVSALHARGLQVLFVEGGGVTVSRFLHQGCLDRLHLAVAPVLVGSGRAGLQLPGFGAMRDCPRPPCKRLAMGDDVLWDLDLQPMKAATASSGS